MNYRFEKIALSTVWFSGSIYIALYAMPLSDYKWDDTTDLLS